MIERPGLRDALVKIKSKSRVTQEDAKVLETLGAAVDERAERWLLSKNPLAQKFGGTRAIPWQKGIQEILSCRGTS